MVVAVASREGLLVFDLSRVIDLDMKSSCGSTAASCFPVFGQHCDLHSSVSHRGFRVAVLLIMGPPAARPAAFDATLTEFGVNK